MEKKVFMVSELFAGSGMCRTKPGYPALVSTHESWINYQEFQSHIFTFELLHNLVRKSSKRSLLIISKKATTINQAQVLFSIVCGEDFPLFQVRNGEATTLINY